MTLIAQLLFATLRAALNQEALEVSRFAPLTEQEWQQLYRLSVEQGVVALAWESLSALPLEAQPPRAVRLQWAMTTQQIEKRYAKQQKALFHLAEFYTRHQLRMMVLKGYGLSLGYPQPNHRPCGDIDIWLFGEQQRGDSLLAAKCQVEISEDEHKHSVFDFEGVHVENHYTFSNIYAHRSNRPVEARMQELAYASNRTLPCGEGLCYLPNVDFEALYLLRHTSSHFAATEIGLRMIVDWTVFVKHHHQEIDWEALQQVAEEANMSRFLMVMNRIAVEWLGAEREWFPAISPDSHLTQRVLQAILSPSVKVPSGSFLKVVAFKFNRWRQNGWKRSLAYREGSVVTFLTQIWSHLLKPKTIKAK